MEPAPTYQHSPSGRLPRIAVVVLHYNGLDDTLACLASLAPAATDAVDVIVVDNASRDDPAGPLAAQHPWCRVVRNAENGGWAGGNNLGIRVALEAEADWVMLLNNDTIVAPQIFSRLRAALAAHPQCGVLGPIINEYAPADKIQTEGCRFNEPACDALLNGHPVTRGVGDPPLVTATEIVNGCCIMISRPTFDRIGLIDERFFLVHEESDFCLRAHEAGIACGVLGESLVWHKHSASFARAGKPLQIYYSMRNAWLLAAKHRRWPGGRRPWATRWLLLRHTWYAYDRQREFDNPPGARAALEGLTDAWLGRFGRREERRRPLAAALDALALIAWKLRGGAARRALVTSTPAEPH